ncbi:unnamed protein product [Lactuca virosa]|uniref:Uncharacterized protein n=1 Tax=Lactuca virosa TaxID=75947 RepID=A0AAU9PJ86_9ASTR|nr:unnamed protein product [Lactuca virosa]
MICRKISASHRFFQYRFVISRRKRNSAASILLLSPPQAIPYSLCIDCLLPTSIVGYSRTHNTGDRHTSQIRFKLPV